MLTYADYCAIPHDGKRYELLDGKIYVGTSPTTQHQRISRNLKFALHGHVLEHSLGEVLNAPVDVILDRGTVVQPDLLFVATPRLAIIRQRAVEGAPDLVVEILSESTESMDGGPKRQVYARYGVTHYWIVAPAGCSLAEHVLHERAYDLRATYLAGQPCKTAAFPELTLDLAAIFG